MLTLARQTKTISKNIKFNSSQFVLIVLQQHRTVGNFKRPQAINLGDNHEMLIKSALSENRRLSNEDWQRLRTDILSATRSISAVNIDATIMGRCVPGGLLEVARSYMDFLKDSQIEPNLATLGKYLKLFQKVPENLLVDDDRKEILELYTKIHNKSLALDATTCENLIYALCLTDEWRKSLDLLEMIKITAKPSTSVYTLIISKAFGADENEIGWRCLNEILEVNHRAPKCEAFISFIEMCHKKSDQEAISEMERLLNFIERHEIVVSRKVITQLRDFYVKRGWICKIVMMNLSGTCNGCRNQLSSIQLSDDEFKQLSTNFLERVLVRKNVFVKTTPDELKRFESFLDKTGPFDCVIDGLNVAFSKGGKKSSSAAAKSIASVVRYFNEQNRRTLVLGRKHMSSWPKQQMHYVRTNSNLFLTEDLSQDDPFLLYAALKSGPQTDFVSRDLMRGHAYLLGPELKPIFRRWQQEHQYDYDRVLNSNEILVREPTKYSRSAHKIKGYIWHVPFTQVYQTNPEESLELTRSWLCISLKL